MKINLNGMWVVATIGFIAGTSVTMIGKLKDIPKPGEIYEWWPPVIIVGMFLLVSYNSYAWGKDNKND